MKTILLNFKLCLALLEHLYNASPGHSRDKMITFSKADFLKKNIYKLGMKNGMVKSQVLQNIANINMEESRRDKHDVVLHPP